MEGVRVVEAAQAVMGPSSGAILADWGADVIHIEHPVLVDPIRTIISTMGLDSSFDFHLEQSNHSKRSLGLDLASSEGRDVFLRVISSADVFITSFLQSSLEKWRIAYDDLREVNPGLVYARSHGQGTRGPEGNTPGYDPTSFWARSSAGYMATPVGSRPLPTPSVGFGDIQGGLALAAGIAGALFRRSQTGEGGLVDVSLLGVGLWDMYEVIQMANVYGIDRKREPTPSANPLATSYQTKDDRDIALCMFQSDRYWTGFCTALGWEHLVDDVRFSSFEGRATHREELLEMIEEHFLSHTLEDLCGRLLANGCVFSAFKTPGEVREDPQVRGNGYLMPHPSGPGKFVVSSPVQFDGKPLTVRSPAPEAGQHTEEILLEFGYSWGQIIVLKDKGVLS